MKDIYIVDTSRTAIGKFGGAFAQTDASRLATYLIDDLLERNNISPNHVDQVILGNVLQAGQGQNCARQAQLGSGIPVEKTSYTINMVCGSGMRAIIQAAQELQCTDAKLIVAGGTENMSLAPYLLDKARTGYRLGDGVISDYLVKDGLWDIFNNYHMGITAENIAEQYGISREEQDVFSSESQNRAEKAQKEGRFDEEITAVRIPQRRGEELVVQTDEHPRHGTSMSSLSKLKPAFKDQGTVTAGNSSGINDGAAVFLLADESTLQRYNLKPLARIVSYAYEGVDPSVMGLGPIPAITSVLKKSGWVIGDVDLYEINEAFAAQSIAVIRDLGLDQSIVNVNGGAIALGHPIGASGARIVTTLLYEMKKRDVHKGIASLCIGGGMGIALSVERV